MTKLILITSEQDTAETIISLADQLFPEKLSIDHCRDAVGAEANLVSSDYELAIYDPEQLEPSMAQQLLSSSVALSVPLYSIERQAYMTINGNMGEIYLNKPVVKDNFEDTMKRAMEFISESDPDSQLPLYQLFARDFENFLREKFWQDVLAGIIKDIPLMAKGIRLNSEDLTVVPVLIEIKEWRQEMTMREKMITLSMIKNVARKLLLKYSGVVLQVKDDTLVALCHQDHGVAKITEDCISFNEECSRLFSVSACCCIGESTHAEGLEEMFESLVTLSRENITGEKLMFLRFGVPGKGTPTKEPDLALWKDMLLSGEYDPLLISITEYFFQATAANRLTFENLRRFSHDFQQILYVVLQEKGVPAHVVFDNEKFDTLWDDAADSLSELLNWIFWSVGEISKHLGSADTRQDKLSEITEYIRNNLSHELTRQELASKVHLSQSALARMFKNGTGMTLTEYIFNLRLETAKRLLQTTSIPIGEAAERCGFRNYSYFYTRFKDAVGVSPSEFRAMHEK
ncbi:MAG: helix-turn-helix transcriptional regulator [Ruminococcaceae bacterium]|nr:helix-turn-helix transcriptional regulator [Oscillospiraceae bacterium]